MDPIEVREERVTTTSGAVPAGEVAPAGDVAPAERGFPVQGAAQPGTASAPATAGTSVYSSRVGVYPVVNRSIQLIWLIVGVVDIILALNFIFWAASANNTGFAHYIYRLGGWLAAPFDGIFNTTIVHNSTSVFRWSDVLAIAIYSIAAVIVTKLVRITATPRSGVNTV